MKTPLSNNCRRVVKLIEEASKVSIIHHWDSDGIASAVLIAKKYKDKISSFIIPRIGEYNIEAIDVNELKKLNPDLVLILDYGIPLSQLKILEKSIGVKVAVIDHHVNEFTVNAFCNPIAFGCAEEEYPSTTWVLREILGLEEFPDIVALGIIGDLGKAIKDSSLLRWIEENIKSRGLVIDDIIHAVNVVDSCYRLVDYECIDYVRRVLIEHKVKDIITDDYLRSKLLRLSEELSKALSSVKLVKEHDGFIKVFKVTTDAYITSLIGRELAYKHHNSIIVLQHEVKKLNKKYIYIRSYKYNLRSVLEAFKSMNMNVGGKDKVLVISCDGKTYEMDTIINTIATYIQA